MYHGTFGMPGKWRKTAEFKKPLATREQNEKPLPSA
jgi:hypothetical protein